MSEQPISGRCRELPYDEMTPEQKEGYHAILESRGRLPGPDQDLGAQPEAREGRGTVGRAFQPDDIRSSSASGKSPSASSPAGGIRDIRPARTNAAPRTWVGRRTRWAIICGLRTSFDDERKQIVYEMAMTLSNARWVPKGLYDRAVKASGHVGITDVIALIGHYTSVAMTLSFYDVPAGPTGMEC
jgi:4-carboxymuconolactone decarboxylase